MREGRRELRELEERSRERPDDEATVLELAHARARRGQLGRAVRELDAFLDRPAAAGRPPAPRVARLREELRASRSWVAAPTPRLLTELDFGPVSLAVDASGEAVVALGPWAGPEDEDWRARVVLLSPGGGVPRILEAGEAGTLFTRSAVSLDGRRIAVAGPDVVRVHESRTGARRLSWRTDARDLSGVGLFQGRVVVHGCTSGSVTLHRLTRPLGRRHPEPRQRALFPCVPPQPLDERSRRELERRLLAEVVERVEGFRAGALRDWLAGERIPWLSDGGGGNLPWTVLGDVRGSAWGVMAGRELRVQDPSGERLWSLDWDEFHAELITLPSGALPRLPAALAPGGRALACGYAALPEGWSAGHESWRRRRDASPDPLAYPQEERIPRLFLRLHGHAERRLDLLEGQWIRALAFTPGGDALFVATSKGPGPAREGRVWRIDLLEPDPGVESLEGPELLEVQEEGPRPGPAAPEGAPGGDPAPGALERRAMYPSPGWKVPGLRLVLEPSHAWLLPSRGRRPVVDAGLGGPRREVAACRVDLATGAADTVVRGPRGALRRLGVEDGRAVLTDWHGAIPARPGSPARPGAALGDLARVRRALGGKLRDVFPGPRGPWVAVRLARRTHELWVLDPEAPEGAHHLTLDAAVRWVAWSPGETRMGVLREDAGIELYALGPPPPPR